MIRRCHYLISFGYSAIYYATVDFSLLSIFPHSIGIINFFNLALLPIALFLWLGPVELGADDLEDLSGEPFHKTAVQYVAKSPKSWNLHFRPKHTIPVYTSVAASDGIGNLAEPSQLNTSGFENSSTIYYKHKLHPTNPLQNSTDSPSATQFSDSSPLKTPHLETSKAFARPPPAFVKPELSKASALRLYEMT